jgi:hypothetical protein
VYDITLWHVCWTINILNVSALKFINMFSLIFCFLYCWAPYVAVNGIYIYIYIYIYIEDVTGKCNSAFSVVLFNNTEKYTKEKTALSYMCHCQYYIYIHIHKHNLYTSWFKFIQWNNRGNTFENKQMVSSEFINIKS